MTEIDKKRLTFRCPICKRYIKIGEWGKSTFPDEPQGTGSKRPNGDLQSSRNMEYRLSNKRYHMQRHRELKRLKERKVRTALRQAEVVRLRENNAGI